jgi:hypothetical protein
LSHAYPNPLKPAVVISLTELEYKMNVKVITIVLLITFVMTSCTPAATPVPTQPILLTITQTPVPIASLTPIPPEPTIALTIVPSPTVEVNMVDLPQSKAAADQFASAMKSAGIQVDADQIRVGLTTKEITGKDGKKYEIALTQDGFPLVIKVGNGEWEQASIKLLLNGRGISFGMTPEYGDKYDTDRYRKIMGDADFIVPRGATEQAVIDQWTTKLALGWADFAHNNNQWIRVNCAFGGTGGFMLSSQIAHETDKNKILSFMQQRLQFLIGDLKPRQLNVVLEPFWYINGQMGFTSGQDPYILALGENWDAKAFQMANDIAVGDGLIPGKDISFYYNVYGIDRPGWIADSFVKRMFILKNSGVPIHGVGIQVYPDGYDNLQKPPTEDQLKQVIKQMSQIGDVYLELEVWEKHADNPDWIKETLVNMAEACVAINIESGKIACSSILIWDDGFNPEKKKFSPFFDANQLPTKLYWETLKSLFSQ